MVTNGIFCTQMVLFLVILSPELHKDFVCTKFLYILCLYPFQECGILFSFLASCSFERNGEICLSCKSLTSSPQKNPKCPALDGLETTGNISTSPIS